MKDKESILSDNNMPKHVALIMDGNGRWAKMKKLPRSEGHRQGTKNLKEIVRFSKNIGIKCLTVYAFSTENWTRSKDEVQFLMKLLLKFLNSELDELVENNVKINILGFEKHLNKDILTAIRRAEKKSCKNDGMIFNIAFNYGSRLEIVNAVNDIIKDIKLGKINEDRITEEIFSKYLLTKNLPDPDILIRTSGEYRLSNYLLYQLAYTEMFFTDTLWPDFSNKEYYEILKQYSSRDRRFGREES